MQIQIQIGIPNDIPRCVIATILDVLGSVPTWTCSMCCPSCSQPWCTALLIKAVQGWGQQLFEIPIWSCNCNSSCNFNCPPPCNYTWNSTWTSTWKSTLEIPIKFPVEVLIGIPIELSIEIQIELTVEITIQLPIAFPFEF